MKDHINNLKEYVENDFTYDRYKKSPNEYFNEFERCCIEHVEDIQWAINELEALYELVKEMKRKNEDGR